MMQRDTSIDIAKGITIILMIVGHCDGLIPSWLFRAIFSFHVPLFFFFSGYFFNPNCSLLTQCKHSATALLIPYLLTGVICVLIGLILYSPLNALHTLQGLLMAGMGRRDLPCIFPYNAGPIWFLFALFWSRILFRGIYELFPRYCILVAGVIGVAFMTFGKCVINLPLAFGQGASALFFYAGGYSCRLLWERYMGVDLKWKIVIFATSLLIWISTISSNSYLNVDQYFYIHFPLPLIGAFAGIWIVWRISACIKGYTSNVLQLIGKYTLDILCCHTIAFKLCSWLTNTTGTELHPKIVAALLTIILSVGIIGIKELVRCVRC